MKHSKWISMLLAGVCALSLLAGCGSKENAETPQMPSQQQSGSNMNDAVYKGSLLNGWVKDFSDGEFSVVVTEQETADDGGAVAVMPAPGSEKAENTTKVIYNEDCKFQIVKIDGAQEKAPEYEDVTAENIKKETQVIIFGEELQSGKVKAEKVLIPQIYNKDKMPGSY